METYITIEIDNDYRIKVFRTYALASKFMESDWNIGKNIVLRYCKSIKSV